MAFEPNDPALEAVKLVEQQNAERNVRVAEKQAVLAQMRAAAQTSNLALEQDEIAREKYRQEKAIEAADKAAKTKKLIEDNMIAAKKLRERRGKR